MPVVKLRHVIKSYKPIKPHAACATDNRDGDKVISRGTTHNYDKLSGIVLT